MGKSSEWVIPLWRAIRLSTEGGPKILYLWSEEQGEGSRIHWYTPSDREGSCFGRNDCRNARLQKALVRVVRHPATHEWSSRPPGTRYVLYLKIRTGTSEGHGLIVQITPDDSW